MDDLLFDSYAWFLVDLGVFVLEELLDFLFVHVGGHFGDELDRNDLILFILAFLEL